MSPTSPTLHLFRRDSCNVFGTDCSQGIRPSTYAIVIAIAVVVILFASGFLMRRRRIQRRIAQPHSSYPETHSHPLTFRHNHPAPPPVFFEPAPPYDVFKASSPSPSPQPATGQAEAPLLHHPPYHPPHHPPPPAPESVPLQYPPPSYTPA